MCLVQLRTLSKEQILSICFSIILLHEKYGMRLEKLKRQAEARKRDPLAEEKRSVVESGPET